MEDILGSLAEVTAKTLLLSVLVTWIWREKRERITATAWSKVAAGAALLASGAVLTGVGALLTVPIVVALVRHDRMLGVVNWTERRLGPTRT